MRKLFIIIAILSSLIIANILINTENSKSKKDIKTLSEAINLLEIVSSFEILQKDNKIKLTKKDSCYEIKSINYCADNRKVKLLKKFVGGKIKDIYENTKENLTRLGFDNVENKRSMIINGNKTLFFGNINQYNEIYVLQKNKIYKVDYYKGMLDIATKQWIDKSKPIISLLETDEFDIEIVGCATFEHKDLVLNSKYSILRNSFFDLYASDVKMMPDGYYDPNFTKKYNTLIVILSPHSKNKQSVIFHIWKEKHLVRLMNASRVTRDKISNQAFNIPNSVYKNIDIFCKK